MQVLYKHVRGRGVWRQNAYIAYVKVQNSYSPENAFKSVKYHLTIWSKVINEKISHIDPWIT